MKKNSEHADRAKQFAPFDPLRGFREALAQRERVVVQRAELTDDQIERLNWKLSHIRPNDMVTVVYFCEGEYLEITGLAAGVDAAGGTLSVVKTKIKFEDIYDLRGVSPEELD